MSYVPESDEEREWLESYDPKRYPVTVVTCDVAVFDTATHSILMIERGGYPYRGKLALPGGFIEPNERISEAAVRELREETGIELREEDVQFLAVADDPERDPRGRSISFAFVGAFSSEEQTPKEGDDASAVVLVPVSEVLLKELAFDHDLIVEAAMRSIVRQRR